MAKGNKHYSFIFESTTVVAPHEIQILEESKTADGKSKIAYKCRLQESGVRNNNRRIYSDLVCESIVSQLSPRAQSRNLLMEIDHPMSGNPEELKKRATIVEIKNCGAVIRNLSFKGGQVIAEMETLSGLK